ncbi:MAG: M56 family metallopeptidase [Flavipsychrobacter sp.]
MNTMHSVTLIAKVLGWTLLHSLWQGLLIAACLFATLKILHKASSRARYYLSSSLLGLFFVLFLNTLIAQWQKIQMSAVYVTELSQSQGNDRSYQVYATGENSSFLNHYLIKASPQLEHYFPLLAVIYLIGLLFMVSRFGINILQLRGLRKNGITATERSWDEWINKYREQFSILRPVQVFLSEKVNVPMVMGTLKPVILLPFTTLSHLSQDQIEAILLHELAHIKRHDYLLNIFQNVVETFLFFNPFMWWISAIVRREREHCCDDMVIANTNQPLSYARALAALEHNRQQAYSMAVAATGRKNQLFNRIKRIMEMKKNSLNYSQLTITILIVGALALSIMCFSPGFAQTTNERDKPKHKGHTIITHQKIIVIDDNGIKKEYNSITEMPAEEKEKLKKELGDNNIVGTSATADKVISDNPDEIDTSLNGTINVAVSNAMNSVNMDSIGKTVEDALKQVDWKAINKNLTLSFNKLDTNIDWKEIQKGVEMSMEQAKKALIENGVATKEMEHAKKEIAIAMEKAKREVKESMAEEEMNRMAAVRQAKDHSNQTMLDNMEADGLISRSDGFKLEKNGDVLYINGKRQSAEVYNKYQPYLLESKKVTIEGRNDSLEIRLCK